MDKIINELSLKLAPNLSTIISFKNWNKIHIKIERYEYKQSNTTNRILLVTISGVQYRYNYTTSNQGGMSKVINTATKAVIFNTLNTMESSTFSTEEGYSPTDIHEICRLIVVGFNSIMGTVFRLENVSDIIETNIKYQFNA